MTRSLAWLLVAALAACTTHIAPYRAKHRPFVADAYPARPAPTGGSLYAGDGWFEDDTARHVGDVLVVRIDERDAATRDASTKLGKQDKAPATACRPRSGCWRR
jgi:flagellar basal body L-ring protein FlgH